MTQPVVVSSTGIPARDYIMIGGDKSPGKCTIRGLNSPRGWDIRQGYGLSGATVVPKGDECSTFSVFFEFFDAGGSGVQKTADMLNAWYAYAAKYFDKSVRLVPGSNVPKALGVDHPILAAPPHRVTEAVVKDVSGLEQDDNGGWSVEVFFLQYRKPKPALAAPNAAIPAAAQTAPTAEDEADREMAAKLATLKGLLK